MPPGPRAARTNLHLLHGWGGGLHRWVRLFAAADRRSRNLVLSSAGLYAYGLEHHLWDAETGAEIDRWVLGEPIAEVALHNPEYAARLRSLIDGRAVEHLYVSSLIGHSLDALAVGVPTTIVHHDFFPFCPALNLYFGSPCRSCRAGELDRCLAANPYAEPFRVNPTDYWLRLRDRYFELLGAAHLTRVCPLPGVAAALCRIDPRFAALPSAVVEHGIDGEPGDCFGGAAGERRLRLLHLGRLNPYRGLASLRALLPRLRLLADVTLLGTGPPGAEFAGLERVQVVEEYRPEELSGWLERLRPDLALFLSQVPETYSLALSEVFLRAIPAVARRLGAFAERIEAGRSGLLFDSDDEGLRLLVGLDRSRSVLAGMSRHLRTRRIRQAGEMVEDYYRLRGGGAA